MGSEMCIRDSLNLGDIRVHALFRLGEQIVATRAQLFALAIRLGVVAQLWPARRGLFGLIGTLVSAASFARAASSGYHLRISRDRKKSASSVVNSQLVGPAPTTINVVKASFSASVSVGLLARSKHSTRRLRMCRAW